MKFDYPILDLQSSLRKPAGLCALAIMAKAPRAGAVKTRLIPPLTPDEAAALNRCFLQDTAMNIADLCASAACEGVVAYTPVGAEFLFKGLLPDSFNLLPQRGDAFGDRLFYAAQDLLALGYESVCLIDSDSPTLPPAILAAAVAALTRRRDGVVLGPADDGGYYLIGLNHADQHLFTSVEWSTERVLSQTIQRAAELHVPFELLPTWYDIDNATSLVRLCNELVFTPHQAGGEGLKPYSAQRTRDFLSKLVQKRGQEQLFSVVSTASTFE
ncbi:MAG: TIGR04282 family arsenosugar biosynthesis glycosyltransferase [Nitrospira sp.]|nr:TIGR04282 family arsenosugar biosynthesis glycosyltransferase [Nitrospira sp.]